MLKRKGSLVVIASVVVGVALIFTIATAMQFDVGVIAQMRGIK